MNGQIPYKQFASLMTALTAHQIQKRIIRAFALYDARKQSVENEVFEQEEQKLLQSDSEQRVEKGEVKRLLGNIMAQGHN